MVGANDITVCKYQLPFRIERRMVTIETVRQEQCEVYLDKIENVYDLKKNRISEKRIFSYKTPDCKIETKFDSFRLIKKSKSIGLEMQVTVGLKITKMNKKYCDQFPPNSLIINYPGR